MENEICVKTGDIHLWDAMFWLSTKTIPLI